MLIFGDFQTSVKRALSEIDPHWADYDGVIICGSHTPKDTERLIEKIKETRLKKKPFLGICYGHQLAAIEYARNVMGIEDATSQEWSKTGTFVVTDRGKLKVGLQEDGESYWSYYEVAIAPKYPTNFFTCPFHPEYNSRKGKPHPLLVDFLNYAKLH